MDIRFNNSRPNWAQIVLLPEKRIFFGKLSLKIENYLPIVIHHATMSQKNPLTVGQIMRYNILLFGAKLNTNHPFALAGDFFKN